MVKASSIQKCGVGRKVWRPPTADTLWSPLAQIFIVKAAVIALNILPVLSVLQPSLRSRSIRKSPACLRCRDQNVFLSGHITTFALKHTSALLLGSSDPPFFAGSSRETVLIWQDGIFTGEGKYAQMECKSRSLTPKWSTHGRKQFGRAEIAFQLSIIFPLLFLQIVNQILSLCLSALGSRILSGGGS